MAKAKENSQGAPADGSGARAGEAGDSAPGARAAASGVAQRLGRKAALLAWLVPGAGHFLLGRKGRGAAMAACVVASLLTGLLIDGRVYGLFEPAPLFRLGAWGELGLGPLYFLLRLAGLAYDPLSPLALAPTSGNGAVFLISAGLMNYLMVLDAYDLAIGRRR